MAIGSDRIYTGEECTLESTSLATWLHMATFAYFHQIDYIVKRLGARVATSSV